MNTKRYLFSFLLILVLLSACNMPTENTEQNPSGTAAAQTVEAMLSATPVVPLIPSATLPALPPTLTPIPLPVNTNTPVATATSNCNVAQFVVDVTIPDGTVIAPGQAFTKKWRIKNVGSCTWNGFSLVFDSGDAMGGAASTAIPVVNPNQEIDLAVNMTAPNTPGKYRGYWRITTNSGVQLPVVSGYQNKSFYVDVKVQSAPTATNTTVPAAFAVTGVTYTVSTWSDATYTNCPRVTAKITVNGTGSVDYYWTRSDNAAGTNGTLVFTAAGSQTVTADWALGSANAGGADEWMGIYIDTPNHQDFGHAVMQPCSAP